MPDMFANVLDGEMTVGLFLLSILIALVVGGILSGAFLFCRGGSRTLLFALFFLPAVIAVTIMSVNGNIGTGVAVAGAFSLVRFRSAPGTAKEIVLIFMAMCAGLLVGMGYFGYGVLLSLLLAPLLVLFVRLSDARASSGRERILKMTVPEDLDDPDAFSEVLAVFTDRAELYETKTAALGSLFRLIYRVKMKSGASERELIDRLRTLNGNLELSLSRPKEGGEL